MSPIIIHYRPPRTRYYPLYTSPTCRWPPSQPVPPGLARPAAPPPAMCRGGGVRAAGSCAGAAWGLRQPACCSCVRAARRRQSCVQWRCDRVQQREGCIAAMSWWKEAFSWRGSGVKAAWGRHSAALGLRESCVGALWGAIEFFF